MDAMLDTRNFLDTLNGLDFGPVAYKLMHPEEGKGLTLEQATDAIAKYKGFLYLYNHKPSQTIAPPLYVDLVWHTHIMDTELYTIHCGLLFGHYLHHNPFFGKRGDEVEMRRAAEETRTRALEVFGWDDDDWCGTGTPEMVAFLTEYVGVERVSLADLIAVWRNRTCYPPALRTMQGVTQYVGVERLGEALGSIMEGRMSPEGYANPVVAPTQVG